MKQRLWFVLALVLVAPLGGCGDDDDAGGEGEGEGEEDSILDIAISSADGVMADIRSVRGYFLEPEVTSCDGLTSRRVNPDEFPNRHAPVFTVPEGPGAPHVTTSIAGGSSQVLIEAYATETASGAACTPETVDQDCAAGERCIFEACIPEPHAAGCEPNVYVAPGDRFNTQVQVRLNP